ncbi:MAG TPA: hypothetical protein VGU01_02980 [Sphingomicrobium sp.]|nr:hypothetical protein [Sphingomicrobium sp.]
MNTNSNGEVSLDRFGEWLTKALSECFGIPRDILLHGHRTCLSCGAKQAQDGTLPRDH